MSKTVIQVKTESRSPEECVQFNPGFNLIVISEISKFNGHRLYFQFANIKNWIQANGKMLEYGANSYKEMMYHKIL